MPRPKGTGDTSGLVHKIKEMTGCDHLAYYIVWKYAPQLLTKQNLNTFDDLALAYACFNNRNQAGLEAKLTEPTQQDAIKYLLERLHKTKLFELYDLYYQRAKEDTQAFRAFLDFSKDFFGAEQNELIDILKGAELED